MKFNENVNFNEPELYEALERLYRLAYDKISQSAEEDAKPGTINALTVSSIFMGACYVISTKGGGIKNHVLLGAVVTIAKKLGENLQDAPFEERTKFVECVTNEFINSFLKEEEKLMIAKGILHDASCPAPEGSDSIH